MVTGEATAEQVYERHIRQLTAAEQSRLIDMILRQMRCHDARGPRNASGKRSIMELHGLGAEIWHGVDAQQYVDALREEWNQHP